MSKDSPTLIDRIIRASFKNSRADVADLAAARPALLAAKRFVLDDSMSSYLAHLCHAPWQVKTEVKRRQITEHTRYTARIPYPKTWIEYSPAAYHAEAKGTFNAAYLPVKDDEAGNKSVPCIGWLLEQHPQVESAIRLTAFCDIAEPVIMPYGMAWTTDDSPIPWQPMKVQLPMMQVAETGEIRPFPAAHLLTGIGGYDTPFIQIVKPGYLNYQYTDKQVGGVMLEFMGELRRAFALLSTINDIPVTVKQVMPSKGYVARGQYRKFLSHSVITLSVPHAEIRKHVKRVLGLLRRRAHEVRGHYREDWRNPPSKSCEHVWVPGVHQQVSCVNCNGRKLWIPHHERGDASLGFVTHGYKLTH